MSKLDDLQDEVFRGIGRNVLNLQKMEGMLKFIALATGEVGSTKDVSQPMTELVRSIRSRGKADNRQTMGPLVEDLSKTLRRRETDQGETVDSENRASMEVSFFFEDEDYSNELSQSLREIVSERNSLIHERLISFDPQSVESCRELSRVDKGA